MSESPEVKNDALPYRSMMDVRVKMRDGVELSTHVHLPKGDGPFPVLFVRTPYQPVDSEAGITEWINRGFARVVQSNRGTFKSDGEAQMWNQINDGHDALEWLSQQPWCNGNVAMYGGSAVGATQTAAAISSSPILKCITPALIGLSAYQTHYIAGAARGNRTAKDHVALKRPLLSKEDAAKDPDHFYNHPQYDEYWKSFAVSEKLENYQCPAFMRTGWFDVFISDTFDLYNGIKTRAGTQAARQHTRIVVGPWPHNINQEVVGDVDLGSLAAFPGLYQQEIDFMSHFTGNESASESKYDTGVAPITLFVMGANVWRDEHEWPLARTVFTDYFFSSKGSANTAKGNGKLGPAVSDQETTDTYMYHPDSPVPTKGGAWTFGNAGQQNQNENETRLDVLVYTSDTLTDDLEVTGPVEVKLFASSSAPDTDFTAKLVDVHPEGPAMSVTDGIVRARYRKNDGKDHLLEQGKVYEFTITLNPTSYQFHRGHKLRVEISSSNSPAFVPNLNTEENFATGTRMQAATQTIYHSKEYPSRIILPVIPQAK